MGKAAAERIWALHLWSLEGAESYRLNDRVDLPEGVKFENDRLTGKFQNEGVYHIDFIGLDADGNAVGAYKLIVTATTNEAAKKGCFGDIAACSAIIGLVAVAGAGLLLLSLRKRKEA